MSEITLAPSDPTQALPPAAVLTGAQKVAVVLMQLDRDLAARVMQRFTEEETQLVTAELVGMGRVEADVADATLLEFHEMTVRGRMNRRGGRDFAAELLEASFGAERAGLVMERVASSMAGKSFEFLEDAGAGQVQALLEGEHPQTVALVLAHLPPAHAAAVLPSLEEKLRTEVAHCIATMSTASPDAVGVIAEALKARAGAVITPKESVEVVGGVQPLVDIINRSDVAVEKAVLDALDERNPELAEEVRSRMLTFADIVKLERRDVQQVLRGVDLTVLATACKGASPAVSETIFANLSERNRERLEEEMQMAGPVRTSHVEDARAEIVRTIRTLESEGSITVIRAEEDEYVY